MTMVFFILVEITTPLNNQESTLIINKYDQEKTLERVKHWTSEKAHLRHYMCPSTPILVTLHLLEDSSTDADVAGEWAFLINISSLNSGGWGLEA